METMSPLSAEFWSRLQNLSELVATSGNENAVRSWLTTELSANHLTWKIDSMGNLFVEHAGKDEHWLLAAHMDEVGLMVVDVESSGDLRFQTVGGIDERVLLGKPVWVGSNRQPGVISAKPVHLLKGKLLDKVAIDNLRIDIGANSRESAYEKVAPGDWATFAMEFHDLGETVLGKALDDRLGVALLLELLLTSQCTAHFTAVFTVQEEVGLRGARVAAYTVNPERALVLESTPAHDLPTFSQDEWLENRRYNTRLRNGPALSILDSSTLHDRNLLAEISQIAEKHHIPYQRRQPGGGGNDAGSIHKSRAGIPSLGISVPTRYIHSPAAIASKADIQATFDLLCATLA